MERLRLYIPSEAVADGDAIVVYGPGADGTLDAANPMARAALSVEHGENGPEGIAERTAQAVVLTPEMGPGVKEFAAVAVDSLGQSAGGTPAAFSVFVNCAPRGVAKLTPAAALVGGAASFDFEGSADL